MVNGSNDFEGLIPHGFDPAGLGTKHRFVVLFHDHPFKHWDWMFETHGTLVTFRSPPGCLNELQSGQPQEWTPLPNHRLQYLDYEGPLTGQRGKVKRVFTGDFLWLEKETARLRMHLAGPTIQGILEIEPDPETNRCLATWTAI